MSSFRWDGPTVENISGNNLRTKREVALGVTGIRKIEHSSAQSRTKKCNFRGFCALSNIFACFDLCDRKLIASCALVMPNIVQNNQKQPDPPCASIFLTIDLTRAHPRFTRHIKYGLSGAYSMLPQA